MDTIEVEVSGLTVAEADQQSVLQLAVQIDGSWNRRDAAAFADLFVPDGDFRFYSGPWIRGRAAIAAFWQNEVFPGLPESMRHSILIQRVRFVTEHVAIGDGLLRFVDVSAGSERILLERDGTLVAVKQNGRWLISAIRLAALAPG